MDHCLNGSMQSVRAHVCRSRCSRGAACGPSWFPPGCTWWQRSGRRTRRSCCQCRKPAGEKAELGLQRSDIAGTDESSHVCFWPKKPFSLKMRFSWFPETNWTKSSEFFFFFYSLLCVMSQTPDSPNREAPPTGGSSALLASQSDYSWPNAKILLSACTEDKSSSCRNTQSCTASAPAADASHTSLRSGTLGLILNSHAQSLLPPVGR